MQENEKGKASSRVSLQRSAKESNEEQILGKNLKTAGRTPFGVRIPGPPFFPPPNNLPDARGRGNQRLSAQRVHPLRLASHCHLQLFHSFIPLSQSLAR
jgi:hypothetical protein